ncbi:MAG: type II secretion system protein, partial [Phycisphaerales bacterium]|nr:type II secretion system protein [Phycisphaerales bacterium]
MSDKRPADAIRDTWCIRSHTYFLEMVLMKRSRGFTLVELLVV